MWAHIPPALSTSELVVIDKKDIKSPDLVQSILLWTSAGGLIMQGDNLTWKSPPQSILHSQYPNNSLVRRKNHSHVNDGLLLHTWEFIVIVRQGKGGGKTWDPQGKVLAHGLGI